MDDTRPTKLFHRFSIIKYISYFVAIGLIIYRLIEGIYKLGVWRGIIRTMAIDCLIWVIVLGWFGFIPGTDKLNLKRFDKK